MKTGEKKRYLKSVVAFTLILILMASVMPKPMLRMFGNGLAMEVHAEEYVSEVTFDSLQAGDVLKKGCLIKPNFGTDGSNLVFYQVTFEANGYSFDGSSKEDRETIFPKWEHTNQKVERIAYCISVGEGGGLKFYMGSTNGENWEKTSTYFWPKDWGDSYTPVKPFLKDATATAWQIVSIVDGVVIDSHPTKIITLRGISEHTHEFEFALDGNSITVTCGDNNCDVLHGKPGTISLTVGNGTIGDSLPVEVEAPQFFRDNSDFPLSIKYNGSVEEPTSLGTYNVTLSIGGVTTTAQQMTLSQRSIETCTPVFSLENGKPSLTMFYKETNLTLGTDFTVAYQPEELGPSDTSCTVTVNGIGDYSGTKKMSFQRDPTPLSADLFTLDQKQFTYTGNACKPMITSSLIEEKDYRVIGYFDNVNVGKAYVEVAGIGDYNGSVKLTYAIRPIEANMITLAEVDESQVNAMNYNGKAQYPAITPMWNGTAVPESDYTVSCGGNVNEKGLPVDAGNYSLVVTFKGNFSGTKSVSYEIKKIPLTITPNDVNVELGDIPQYTATAIGLIEGETLETALTSPVLYRLDYPGADNSQQQCSIKAYGAEAKNYEIAYGKDAILTIHGTVRLTLPVGFEVDTTKSTQGISQNEDGSWSVPVFGTVIFSLKDGYVLQGDVTTDKGEKLDPTDNVYSLQTYELEQEVIADVSRKMYTISVEGFDPKPSGIMTADVYQAGKGDTVIIDYSLNDKYYLKELEVYYYSNSRSVNLLKKVPASEEMTKGSVSFQINIQDDPDDDTIFVKANAEAALDLAEVAFYFSDAQPSGVNPVEGENRVFSYNGGNEVKPKITLYDLTEMTDYTVSYEGDTTGATASTLNYAQATVVITGCGQLAGQVRRESYYIKNQDVKIDIANADIYLPDQYKEKHDMIWYNFEDPDCGRVSITYNGMQLIPHTDFEIDCGITGKYLNGGDYNPQSGPDEIGAKAKVQFKGIGRFEGTIESNEFTVVVKPEKGKWMGMDWEISSDGVFTIEGSGDMVSAIEPTAYPWFEKSSSITKIVIGEGITSIGDFAFASTADVNYYNNLSELRLPSTLKTIGNGAFMYANKLYEKNISKTKIDETTGETVQEDNWLNGITEIGSEAFYWCDFSGNPTSIRANDNPGIVIPEGANFGFLSFNDWAIDKTNLATYTVTYDLQGGTLSDASNIEVFTVLDEFGLKNPTRAHYKFLGWTCTGAITITEPQEFVTVSYRTKGNLAFIAHWMPITHNIYYDLNGGTNHPDNPSYYEETDEANKKVITIQPPTREGYYFYGWSEYADTGSTTLSQTREFDTYGSGQATMYFFTAHWTPIRTDTPDMEYNGSPYAALSMNPEGSTTYYKVTEGEQSATATAPTIPGDYMAIIDVGNEIVKSTFTIEPKLIKVTGLKSYGAYVLGSEYVDLDASGAVIYGALNASDISVKSAKGKIRNTGVGNNKQIDIYSITFGGEHPEYYGLIPTIEKIDMPDNSVATQGNGMRLMQVNGVGEQQNEDVELPQISLRGDVRWVNSWTEFQNALDTCPNGSTLKMEGDLTATSGENSLMVPVGRTVTIDLMGHNLDASGTGDCAIIVRGVLSLQDTAGTGKITGASNSGIRVEAGTETIDGESVPYTGSFLIYSGNITGNTTSGSGGGVTLTAGSKLIMLGGSITGNTAGTSGGGVYVAAGAGCYLENGSVLDNTVNESANNIYLEKDCVIRIALVLEDEASFGITTQETPIAGKPVTITNGLLLVGEEGISHFSSDNNAWKVAINGYEAALTSSDKIITGADLVLYNDITVRFYAKVPEEATDVSMVFTMNGKSTTQTGTKVKDELQFSFTGVCPQNIRDDITATISFKVDDVELTESRTYSVRQYCENLLRYTDDKLSGFLSDDTTTAELRTLLTNVLFYGAEAQKYMNYKTDTLATANLTEDQKAFASVFTVPGTEQGVVEHPLSGDVVDDFQWAGANLSLTNAAAIRLYFTATNIEGLIVTTSKGDFDSSMFKRDGSEYFVEISKISAGSFQEIINAKFIVDGVQKGQEVNYSLNTYVSRMYNDNTAGNLVKALYNYGKSAYQYAH